MGLSLCSQAPNGERGNLHAFQHVENLFPSEEQEDTDDDSEYFNLGRMGKCISMPDPWDLEKAVPLTRAKSEQRLKSREYAFQGKKKEWHRSSVVNREAEHQAKRYSKMVMDDSLKHLSHTIRTADLIVEKGAAINNELTRQEHVLSKAETDILVAEYETDQVTQKLKGMKSLRGKLKNVIWKKEPKLRRSDFDSQRSTFSKLNLDLLKDDVGLCAFSRMESKSSTLTKEISEDMQQIQIKEGMRQLHKALDIMAVQQMEAAGALDSQEGRLSIFENDLTTTNRKINCQSQMISSIVRKS